MIRVDKKTHDRLCKLSNKNGQPIGWWASKIIDEYEVSKK